MSGAVAGDLLRLSSIGKRYGATLALGGVDLSVRAGEVHAVLGENGAGKSTLMGVVAGAVRPDSGTMELGGVPYTPDSPLAARRRGIALIHQELSLCPHLTVAENVLLGVEESRRGWIDRDRTRARTLALLEELPHPDITPDRKVSELSLPARQIVEVCRALAADARVVLMDEPTSCLQGADVEQLFALVRRLVARGIAVVYISHFLEEVRAIADRFTVLRDGRSVGSGSIAGTSNEALIAQMVGRASSGLFPVRRSTPRAEVALSVRDLAAPPRLRSASFELHRGEIFGVAGLMGSGRTELIRALFGLDHSEHGVVALHRPNAAPRGAGAAQRVRDGMGYLSEDRQGEGLTLPLSITDNLCATRPLTSPRWGGGVLDLAAQTARARHWISELRVRARSPGQAVRALSGGNQQKVAIGRLLHQEADVLLLDEPTRGIDIGSKADVYEVIVREADAGRGVLFVSSYLPELFGLCDRLAVMCRGTLGQARPITEWTPELVMAAAIGEGPAEPLDRESATGASS
ncbi:MAG: sugar ABC transporter ATP-binding protein [Gemmatimonadota bacterium]|nr:sugar ABC transporter ATP-binding protein [Gemmatimonadota bacterium]